MDKEEIKDPEEEIRCIVGVFEEFRPEWTLLEESFRTQKDAIYKEFYNSIEKLKVLERKFETAQDEFHRKIHTEYEKLSEKLNSRENHLNEEREKFARETNKIKDIAQFQSEKVRLNVGGIHFETSLATLRRDPRSLLAVMFSGRHSLKPEADGSYFIDRDGTHFRIILNYLRDFRISTRVTDDSKIVDELTQEAAYYQIAGLSKLKWMNLPRMTQENLHQMYRPNTITPILFNLSKQNLSGLSFAGYHIDPKSTFNGSNLEVADFEGATFGYDFNCCLVDFSNTNLIGARFPPSGTSARPAGVQFELTGARTDDVRNL